MTRAGRYVQQPSGYRASGPCATRAIGRGGSPSPCAARPRSPTKRRRPSRPSCACARTIAPASLKDGRAAGNGHRILEKLFDHSIVTVATVRKWFDITPAGANQLVSRLVDVGVLSEFTGYARNRRFRFGPYLRLFAESEEGRA